jgi:hypothetical protein
MCVCKYFSLCIVCVNIFFKKYIYIFFTLHACDRTYPVRSIAYTGLHLNSLAFVRA